MLSFLNKSIKIFVGGVKAKNTFMKNTLISFGVLILSFTSLKAQVKLYNVDLPYFNKSNLVKPAKSVKNVNNFTKRVVNIIEYNAMGQLHGINIEYRNDTTVSLVRYYHNGRLIYVAQPFTNGSTIQKVFNYNDNGIYNGKQSYTYLNSDTNKWNKAEFLFNNGRLADIDNSFKFPNYTVNFKDGKLNGEFYFYDNLHCSCYYYGFAENGKLKSINKFQINSDLSFKNTFYTFSDKSIKSTTIFDYRNPFEESIEISEVPVIVENKNIHLENDKNRIVFDKQHDWMSILASVESYNENNSDDLELDWSKASVPPPSPYTLPQKQQ